jgi:hypothetical protein
MNTQVNVQVSQNPTPKAERYLADLMIEETWGLARAAQSPALQALCFGLGDHFSALAQGKPSPRGLQRLLPLLLRDCCQELRLAQARPMDFRVLFAARLVWAAPSFGQRGIQAVRRAWLRVWKRQAGAAVYLANWA